MPLSQPHSRPLLGAFLVAAVVAVPTSAAAAPYFGEPSAAPFDPQPCSDTSETGCWTNYLRVVDYDGDRDLDVVMVNYSGFFVSGLAEPLVIYRNDGDGTFEDVSSSAVGGYTAKLRQIAFGDIDGDGDLDLFAPSGYSDGDALFVNDDGVFIDELDQRMPEGTNSQAGATRFGDFDGDADLDLFVATGYAVEETVWGTIYVNDGAGMFTLLNGALPASPGGEDPDDVDLFDADNDFDLDILLNMHSGDNKLFLNEGDGTFVDASEDMDGQPNMFHYNPAICDVDGDGDLDVWVDNMGPDYTEQLLINQGDGRFVDETAARVSMNPPADDNGIICADVDLDGDFDAIVVSLGPAERLLQNDGQGNFTLVDGAFDAVPDPSLWGEVGDLDGDGRLELVTGQGEQEDWTNKIHPGAEAQPVDDLGPVLRAAQFSAMVAVGEAQTIRFAMSDRDVSDHGPRLRASVNIANAEYGFEADATFMGGDLFTVTVPGMGVEDEYELEFCGVDFAGNERCSEPVPYVVGPLGGTSGFETEGGVVDETGELDDDDGTGSTDADGEGSDATAGDAGQAGTSDGCGCRTTSGESRPWLVAMIGLALVGLRRRRA